MSEALFPALAGLVLDPAELGEGHLVVGVAGQDRLVELGGLAQLALVLQGRRLVEGLGQLLRPGQAHRAGGGLAGQPLGGEERDGDDQGGGERGGRATQQPTVAPARRGPRSGRPGRASAARRRRRRADPFLVTVGGIGRVQGGDRPFGRRFGQAGPVAGPGGGRCRAEPSLDRGQPAQVALAQGQVVPVGEVAGQVLGVGVGQRPDEEPPALLELARLEDLGPASGLVGRRDRRR